MHSRWRMMCTGLEPSSLRIKLMPRVNKESVRSLSSIGFLRFTHPLQGQERIRYATATSFHHPASCSSQYAISWQGRSWARGHLPPLRHYCPRPRNISLLQNALLQHFPKHSALVEHTNTDFIVVKGTRHFKSHHTVAQHEWCERGL